MRIGITRRLLLGRIRCRDLGWSLGEMDYVLVYLGSLYMELLNVLRLLDGCRLTVNIIETRILSSLHNILCFES